MLARILMISLATIVLSSFLLFIYFKSKISKVEEKVDIMFTLIQEHVNEKPRNMNFSPEMPMMQNTVSNSEDRVNLIDVSDRDEESESDDSDSDENDSDSDENELTIGNDCDEDIKKIALNLETNNDVLFENLEEDIIVKKDKNVLKNDDDGDDDDNDDGDDDDDDDDDNNDDDDDEDKPNVQPEIDLNTLKVPQLKTMCEENGMTGYKKLKKAQLIELLKE